MPVCPVAPADVTGVGPRGSTGTGRQIVLEWLFGYAHRLVENDRSPIIFSQRIP